MRTRMLAALLLGLLSVPMLAAAKEKKEKKEPAPVLPIGWLYLREGSRELAISKEDFQKGKRPLPQGSLVPVFKTKESNGATYGKVASLNLQTGMAEQGWVKIDRAELRPAGAYPPDDELVPLLGQPYYDDVVAKHTDMARFLVPQAGGQELLLCYVLTGQLSMARLALFTPSGAKFAAGASVAIPLTEIQNGITWLEVRDLVGDGGACEISKETFRDQAGATGINLIIRRIVDGQFHQVWQAPIKYQNFAQYNRDLKILQPPEKNMGAPGTVTTGEVTYEPSGSGQTPVFKGKVEFFVVNREKPLDSVTIEKSCPWDGKEFAPLR